MNFVRLTHYRLPDPQNCCGYILDFSEATGSDRPKITQNRRLAEMTHLWPGISRERFSIEDLQEIPCIFRLGPSTVFRDRKCLNLIAPRASRSETRTYPEQAPRQQIRASTLWCGVQQSCGQHCHKPTKKLDEKNGNVRLLIMCQKRPDLFCCF